MPSAMGNKGEPPEMREANLLAPWYVTGKLDEAERRELDDLIKDDPDFARLLEEARQEAEADVFLNEALEPPSRAVWERLERSIEQEKRAPSPARLTGWIGAARGSIADFLGGFSKPQWQMAAAAAVLICAVQAGAIVYLASGGQGPAKYVTASGQKASTLTRPAFIVSFAPEATISDVNAALDGAGVIIMEGPNSDMLYHLGLRDDTIIKDQAYNTLRASAVVKLILPAN